MFFPFVALAALSLVTNPASGAVRFRHEALGVQRQQQQQKQLAQQNEGEALEKRQLIVPSIPSSVLENIVTLAVEEATPIPAIISSTPVSTVYSYYYPSPSAYPTPITQQSQVETTYVPRITTCKGPPIAFEILQQAVSPFLNSTSIIYGTSPITCDTLYYTEITTICATTLTGVASKVIVSECSQDVTFSSDFGATTVTPRSTVTDDNGDSTTITAAPSLQLRTTYYLAPWQSLAASVGILPTDVDVKVCHQRPDNDTIEDCIRMEESWAVLPVTLTSSYTSSVDVLVTLTEGPGEYVVGTVHGQFVGNATIVSLSTEMILNYAYDAQTISRGPRLGSLVTETVAPATPENVPAVVTQSPGGPGALSTIKSTSTTTRTRVVELASSVGDDGETTFLTATSTSTVYSGTSTIYDNDSPLSTESPVFLGFPGAIQNTAEDTPFALLTPSAVALFAESSSATPEAASPTAFDVFLENFLLSSVPSVEAPSTLASLGTLSLLTLEAQSSSFAVSTTLWTPEFTPVTESPPPGASPVLVPPPAFKQPSLPAFLQALRSSVMESSTSVVEGVASAAAPVPTPALSIKWFNTTT
ncbi:hypothetical protein MPH_11182 [Macrophomina phaseolina MS6]|uniref:Uncharacterized protein n=1 Tax=Macrophomina phaseolina (strain MS6) TaxID=1126212 RepID=K2RNB5_MACPH|nr:hypothetical protein MPH_11182 [Macrophomina phaseolina MS6]